MITRRRFIAGTTSALLLPSLVTADQSMPSLFFGHGGPPLARDQKRGRELAEMAQLLPAKPSGRHCVHTARTGAAGIAGVKWDRALELSTPLSQDGR